MLLGGLCENTIDDGAVLRVRRHAQDVERDVVTTVEPQVVSVPAAAIMLGIGRNFAYEPCRSRQLPSVRLGRRIVIPKIAIETILEAGAREESRTG